MKAYRICAIPGDGIGLEVVPAALDVLEATGLPSKIVWADAGWECFQNRGTALPTETLSSVNECDATLFGAVSSPLSKVAGYQSPIVEMRRELGLYANIRPVHSWPVKASREGIDLLIVRENTEGLYSGREHSDGETAIGERVITLHASKRVVRKSCELAMDRRRHLTIVHKANVLTETCGLFRRAALDVTAEYPDLEVDEVLVDAMAMYLIMKPEQFDVIVTTNLFGDILSDEAAMTVGGLGLAASGNLGDGIGVFEPVHGSAPTLIGKNQANPLAAIGSMSMMLEHLGEKERARAVEKAMWDTLADKVLSHDLGGQASTTEVTSAVIEGLAT
jgi:homoisocitrate dehydrogenase